MGWRVSEPQQRQERICHQLEDLPGKLLISTGVKAACEMQGCVLEFDLRHATGTNALLLNEEVLCPVLGARVLGPKAVRVVVELVEGDPENPLGVISFYTIPRGSS